jgi:membrane protein DedA with SNARE-associated domain
MFTVGERVAAGKFPLWLAVTGFEVIAVLGTTALFLACRGPAQRIITPFGPRLGLTEARLSRAAAFAETRGRPGLALGRGTPGLRTLTVIAAGVSGLNGSRALPGVHRRDAADRPGARPGRADRAGPGPPGTR